MSHSPCRNYYRTVHSSLDFLRFLLLSVQGPSPLKFTFRVPSLTRDTETPRRSVTLTTFHSSHFSRSGSRISWRRYTISETGKVSHPSLPNPQRPPPQRTRQTSSSIFKWNRWYTSYRTLPGVVVAPRDTPLLHHRTPCTVTTPTTLYQSKTYIKLLQWFSSPGIHIPQRRHRVSDRLQ